MNDPQVKKAKYIVLDGIDGSGKSSIIERLGVVFVEPTKPLEELRREGIVGKHSVITREPGGTPLGEKLRGLILNDTMTSFTEMCLLVAQRAEIRKEVVESFLFAGVNVFSDRSLSRF